MNRRAARGVTGQDRDRHHAVFRAWAVNLSRGLDFTLGRIDYSGSACFIGSLIGGAKEWRKGR